MIREVHSVSGSWILIFYPSRIPDPWVKKEPDPGSEFATLFFFIKKEASIQAKSLLLLPSSTAILLMQRLSILANSLCRGIFLLLSEDNNNAI